MVLLDYVVQIFILTNLDINSFVTIIIIDPSSVGSAFINIDFDWLFIGSDGFADKALRGFSIVLCRQQIVHGIAFFIDCAIKVFPLSLDLDIRLVQSPAFACRLFKEANSLFQLWRELDDPAVNRGMVDFEPTLRRTSFKSR